MTKDEILQWFAVKRGAVCVDRREVDALPGYLRHVTLRAPARVDVEFLWHSVDEGGPTFVADASDLDSAIHCLEKYLGMPLAEWENFSTSDRYPELRASAVRNPERVRDLVASHMLELPPSLSFSIQESYWRSLAES